MASAAEQLAANINWSAFAKADHMYGVREKRHEEALAKLVMADE